MPQVQPTATIDEFQKFIGEVYAIPDDAFGLANSAKINIADELSKMYRDNCHVCHKAPCECSFSAVAEIQT